MSIPAGPVVVLGVTSPIGRAVAERFARAGHSLIVTGRDAGELERTAADLRVRHGQTVDAFVLDASAVDALAPWWRDNCAKPGGATPAGLIVCWGDMPEQSEGQADPARLRRMIEVNVAGTLVVLEAAASTFGELGQGFICGLTSVAGDRGRPSNYLYGATKAAQIAALEGLRGRLWAKGVCVLDVRPGFVDTGLTWGRPGVFLAAAPERIAEAVYRGVDRGKAVVYAPFFWRFIMAAIRAIPRPLFQRLSL